MFASQTVVPEVQCVDARWSAVLKTLESLQQPLKFSWLLTFAWVQMLLYQLHFKRWIPPVEYEPPIYIPVGSHGDVVSLEWVKNCPCGNNPKAPLAMVFSTLLGKNQDVIEAIRRLMADGFRVVVFHRRGHNGLPLKSPSWNIMGNPEDVRAAVDAVFAQYPEASMVMLGASAGTGVIGRYLASDFADPRILGSALLSPGFELIYNFAQMNCLISFFFTLIIKRHILLRHWRVLHQTQRYYYALLCCWTMTSLYKNLWGVAGFESFEAYHAATDPVANMDKIRTRTLTICFRDDPACVWPKTSLYIFEQNPYGTLVSLPYGGHLGSYVWCSEEQSWGVRTAVDYLRACVEHPELAIAQHAART